MELSPKQQTTSLILNAQRILLLTHQNPDGDAIGSILGFYLVLKKLKKDVWAACVDPPPAPLRFLPFFETIKNEFKGTREFVINLNCTAASVDKLGYKLEGNNLKIIIQPKGGNFKKEDLSVSFGAFQYDLIIVLDTPDLERLGALYEQNSDAFYETPTVNIDHHPTNAYFGKVNLVDLTATSTSEILIALIEALDTRPPSLRSGVSGREGQGLLDAHVATCLLTGIVSDTSSFQNTNTTPKSLTCAAQLIAAGAGQQEIVKNLFKTKTLSTLKLWGRILEKIKEEPAYRFVYSRVTKEDLSLANAKEEEIAGVIDELLRAVPACDLVLLLSERQAGIAGSLRAINKAVDCTQIAKAFGGGGHQAAAAFLIKDGELDKIEPEVLEKIRDYQKKRLTEKIF